MYVLSIVYIIDWLNLPFASITCVFFFMQKTAYEMRISDWSADVCSSDLSSSGSSCSKSKRVASASSLEIGFQPSSDSGESAVRHFGFGRSFQNQIGRASCRERVCQYV